MPELWNGITKETTFNGKPLGDRMGRVTFKPFQKILMVRYIVRYGLIPATAKSGGSPAELFAAMGSVGPLHARYIHHKILDAVERRARQLWYDHRYQPSHVGTTKLGQGAVVEEWRYPEFMQKWLDEDWDGNQDVPDENDSNDDAIAVNGDGQKEDPVARGSGNITPPPTPSRSPPRQDIPPPQDPFRAPPPLSVIPRHPSGAPPANSARFLAEEMDIDPPPTPIRRTQPPFVLPWQPPRVTPASPQRRVPPPPMPIRTPPPSPSAHETPIQRSTISVYYSRLHQLHVARGALHGLFLRHFRGEPLRDGIQRAVMRIDEMTDELIEMQWMVLAEYGRASLAARTAVLDVWGPYFVMQRSNHNCKPRHSPPGSRNSSTSRKKHGRDGDKTQRPRWSVLFVVHVIVVVLVLGVIYCRRTGADPAPEPPKPSPVPDPELVRICNHHHKIYNLQPHYTENLDLFEVLGLDGRSPVFGAGKRNGRATAQDDTRAADVIQDAMMVQVERNLDGKRGRDSNGNSRAAAALRRIIVDTGLLLQNATIRKLYIDGFMPVKEKSRNRGSEKWLGAVCNSF
ncbi:hypothetical protein GQ607_016943 [Colletotrichum asianum]|uniref:Uncharacterized protein n=1 Tax=Colletotrichum asianum TaxID=702518 RepID=A0A8H3ZH48_9PEZI|nr:hypothetical protein GQ607_016943 [Colletotrichum asianum]